MRETDKIREAYRHCEDLVRASDKDHYLASLFAPAERRPYLLALYAFAIEIGRVKAVVTEPITGMIRLQWWLEALAGLRAEEAAASPVLIALQDAARQTGVSLSLLTAAVEARQAELQGAAANEANIFVMAARFLGGNSEAIVAEADQAARAVASVAGNPQKARESYAAFRAQIAQLPEQVWPAFLTACLVPLRLRYPDAPQWRRQIAMLRTAWLGFPRL
jgi:phytoene/squalene synthetase